MPAPCLRASPRRGRSARPRRGRTCSRGRSALFLDQLKTISHSSRRDSGSTPTVGSSSKQQFRRAHQRAGEAELLLHAAGQLAREALGESGRVRSSPSGADRAPRAAPAVIAVQIGVKVQVLLDAEILDTGRISAACSRCGPGPAADRPRRRCPATCSSPSSAAIRPAIRRSSVVLPAPSGPTSAVSVPACASKETPSSALTISPVSRRKRLVDVRAVTGDGGAAKLMAAPCILPLGQRLRRCIWQKLTVAGMPRRS